MQAVAAVVSMEAAGGASVGAEVVACDPRVATAVAALLPIAVAARMEDLADTPRRVPAA